MSDMYGQTREPRYGGVGQLRRRWSYTRGMLIFDWPDHGKSSRLDAVMVGMRIEEVSVLIDQLENLKNNPEFHHDHLEDSGGSLTVFIVQKSQLNTYHEDLRPDIEAYLANQG